MSRLVIRTNFQCARFREDRSSDSNSAAKVLFPHPDGPINAVTISFGVHKEISFRARDLPYHSESDLTSTIASARESTFEAVSRIANYASRDQRLECKITVKLALSES